MFSIEYSLLQPRSALGARSSPAHASSLRLAPHAHLHGTRFHQMFGRLYERAGVPWVVRLSIVHFRGWCIRQVSCYTLHSGFRLPWPPPCCLDAPTPFMVSDERTLWYLRYAFGSSRIASPAYQAWPTWGSDSRLRLTEVGRALRPLRV